jgi:hypothetical protein
MMLQAASVLYIFNLQSQPESPTTTTTKTTITTPSPTLTLTPTPPPGLPQNPYKLLTLINETLGLIGLMNENLRSDPKVMIDVSLALVGVEALAGVLAERAYRLVI